MTEKRIKFETRIPGRIIDIKNVFTSNNFKLYIVGGAVRDMVMGVSPKDWDLATDATPDEVESIMNGDGFRTVGTGKSFGVINVFIDDEEYEIATFRIDSYNKPTLDNFKVYLKSLNNGKYEEFLNKLMK